jgi:hypothetical protein
MGLPWDDPDADPLADIRALHDATPPRFDVEMGVLGPVAKPRPPGRLVPLPVYLWWRAWVWLSWPWQRRQLKKAGWRKAGGGWMEAP